MNIKMLIAILLIVGGIAAISYEGFTYKTQEKAVDLGPIEITTQKTHHVPISPILGGVAILGGIVLFFKKEK